MAISSLHPTDELTRGTTSSPGALALAAHAHASAVSWGAILAGAAAAAALSLIMLILGTGLGLSSVSPWSGAGISATTFGVSTILWLGLTQLLASGMGGYLAGRLRSRWVQTQRDEVYFRDTAHGFLAWAIASLATAALLSSVIGNILGNGVQAGATVASSVANAATTAGAVAASNDEPTSGKGLNGIDPTGYFVDVLFRRDTAASTTNTAVNAGEPLAAASSVEVTRIFANALQAGALPQDDARYLGQLVAQRTGLSQVDAEKRVNDTFTRAQAKLRETQTAAKETADKARKASAYAALWLFTSLLIGAFVASWSATFGGRLRDA